MSEQLFEATFEPIGRRVQVDGETSLYDAARLAGIALTSACGGAGRCGQCRVQVVAGAVSAPVEAETLVFTADELAQGMRLACRTRLRADAVVNVPQTSQLTKQRLQIAGVSQALAVDSPVQAYDAAAEAPTLEDLQADTQRVLQALEQAGGPRALRVELAAAAQISQMARPYGWRMTVFSDGAEALGVAPAGSRALGMAVDLGTTKLAAYLVDLESGEDLAATGRPNPQISYGEDVISRLAFTRSRPDGMAVMSGLIREALDGILGDLVQQAGVLREQVAELCIVGNTAMTHLLLALPVEQLTRSPFVAATSDTVRVRARELGLDAAPGAWVYVPPSIGGFVGADHVAMIVASDLDRSEQVSIGIDIGTNTEIALIRPQQEQLYAVSCASGPAFEGAHISDGMRAAAGAIEAVSFTPSGVQVRTIDDAPPVGLCGSGIVDAIAELYRWGVINANGRFDRDNGRVRQGRRGPEMVLAASEPSRKHAAQEVVITQADVNEIQLAKGAIRAGLDVLLASTGTAPEEVLTVYVAGAFGSYLDLESALAMGLLPRLPQAAYRQIGNAAVIGAKRALVSQQERARLDDVARRTEYIELTTHPRFRRLFALGMLFPQQEGQRNGQGAQEEG